jgi:S-layer protein (TIGR01567 family)
MKGDFSRNTFSQEKHYSGVLMQQGRVQMDADWNEQQAIHEHRVEVEANDVIGRCGTPSLAEGFRIGVLDGGIDLSISPGRFYVDGILCELEDGDSLGFTILPEDLTRIPPQEGLTITIVDCMSLDGRPFEAGQWVELSSSQAREALKTRIRILSVSRRSNNLILDATEEIRKSWQGKFGTLKRVNSYLTQPDLPNPEPLKEDCNYAVYLDVWKRHITALDDPLIKEKALGDPDTATRVKIVWQVRLLELEKRDATGCYELLGKLILCDSISTGSMNAHIDPTSQEPKECELPLKGGYQWMENQLYRVEIHNPGELGVATFKGSRDNGSVVSSVTAIDAKTLTLSDLGRDDSLGFHDGDWVELIDDDLELNGNKGHLAMMTIIEKDKFKVTINPSPPTELSDISKLSHPKLRLWTRAEAEGIKTQKEWVRLEGEIEVQFSADGHYQTGDYWLIPARAASQDSQKIEWPQDENKNPIPQPPLGVYHHCCPLAIISSNKKGEVTVASDCRKIFPALTDLTSFFYVGGGGQDALASHELDQPLQVGVTNCKWPVANARVEFEVTEGGGLINGSEDGFKAVKTGNDGIASCTWKLGTSGVQQVKATLRDANGGSIGTPPIFFNANIRSDAGTGCVVSVKPGVGSLAGAIIDDLLTRGNVLSAHICLLPGDHELPDGLEISRFNGANLRISGCGSGTTIKIDNKPLILKNFSSVTLKDLKIQAGEMHEDAILFDGCDEVKLEDCSITGVSMPVTHVLKKGSAVGQLGVGSLEKDSGKLKLSNNDIVLGESSDILLDDCLGIRITNLSPFKYQLYKKITGIGTDNRILGSVVSDDFSWDPSNFSGFFRDTENDLGTEKLATKISETNKLKGPDGIRYTTSAQDAVLKCASWGSYKVIGFLGERYFAAYNQGNADQDGSNIFYSLSADKDSFYSNQLEKILKDSNDEVTLAEGESLSLDEGYKLTINKIDIDGNKVSLTLFNRALRISKSLTLSPFGNKASELDKTYCYVNPKVGNQENLVTMSVHFKNIPIRLPKPKVVIDGIWQISGMETLIKVDTSYTMMRIKSLDTNNYTIEMDNKDHDVILGKNSEIALMGEIKFNVASSESLRYQISRDVALPGSYEVRGAVVAAGSEVNAKNFPGLFYDLKNDLSTEKLTAELGDGKISVNYETSARDKAFEHSLWGSHKIIGLMGERYFAGYNRGADDASNIFFSNSTDRDSLKSGQLQQILIDSKAESTVTSDTPLKLMQSYTLAIKSIDVDGNKVLLELSKDGAVVDSKVVSPSNDGATELDKTYFYKNPKVGEQAKLVTIGVHFKNAFRGADQNLANVDGIWQISDTPLEILGPETITADSALITITNVDQFELDSCVLQSISNDAAQINRDIFGVFPTLGSMVGNSDRKSFSNIAREVSASLIDVEGGTIGEMPAPRKIARDNLTMSLTKLEPRLADPEKKSIDLLIKEMDRTKEIHAADIARRLIDTYDVVMRSRPPGTALVISDGKGDATIKDNRITGIISLYGPTNGPQEFSSMMIESLKNDELLKIVKLAKDNLLDVKGQEGVLRLRGNRITRMDVGWRVVNDIKKLLDQATGKLELSDAFWQISLADNIINRENNFWIAREIRFHMNRFDVSAGLAISCNSIYVGNSGGNTIVGSLDSISTESSISKKAANDICISDL